MPLGSFKSLGLFRNRYFAGPTVELTDQPSHKALINPCGMSPNHVGMRAAAKRKTTARNSAHSK